jgi:hypothetical protein
MSIAIRIEASSARLVDERDGTLGGTADLIGVLG